MSIKRTRNQKAFVADSEIIIGNNDAASSSVISSSHFKNVLGIYFFKFQKWDQKLANMGKDVSGKLHAIKIVARRFFPINYFYATKGRNKFIYKSFVDALNLEFDHILNGSSRCEFCALRNKKAAISIDESSKVDQIFPSDFLHIKKFASITHKFSFLLVPYMVIKTGINIHRDRLSEWNPSGYAIVGPA